MPTLHRYEGLESLRILYPSIDTSVLCPPIAQKINFQDDTQIGEQDSDPSEKTYEEPLIQIPDYRTEYSSIDKNLVTVEMEDSIEARIAMQIAIVGTRELNATGSSHDGSWNVPPDDALFKYSADPREKIVSLTLPANYQNFRTRYKVGYLKYLRGLRNSGIYSDEVTNRERILDNVLIFLPDQRSKLDIVYRKDFRDHTQGAEQAFEYEAELIARGMDYRVFPGVQSTSIITTTKPSGDNFREHFRVEVFEEAAIEDVRHLVHGAFLLGIFASVETNTRIGTVVLMNNFGATREDLIRTGKDHLIDLEVIKFEEEIEKRQTWRSRDQSSIGAEVDFAA